MKPTEKQKNNNEETLELTGLLLGLFRELFSPEPKQTPPPPPARPVNVQVIVLPRKKGIIRRFFNWLW